MKIIDECGDDFIELELLEVLPDHLPTPGDRNILVRVNSRNFSGEVKNVWLDYDLIQKFVLQINRMEEFRNGEAEITSQFFNEFLLRIGFYDELGHVFFEGHVCEQYYDGVECKIEFFICPDTSMFRQYVSELNRLLTL